MDIIGLEPVSGYNDEKLQQMSKRGHYNDDWGSVWFVGEPGVMGEVIRPVLDDWNKMRKFIPPFHLIENRNLSYVNKCCEKSSAFNLSGIAGRPFERLQFLRGSQNLYLDIAYDCSEFYKLLEMVHEYNLKDIEFWCKSEVDGVFFMDDWGSNDSLLIDPKIWREVFKPLYREYCDAIHHANKFAFFHTDGFTEPIYNDFIDVGIDAINSQLFVMNIEELGRKYKGKITFWGELDRQKILPFGSQEDVYNAVKRVRMALDDVNGGLISHCTWSRYDPIENIKAFYRSWNDKV